MKKVMNNLVKEHIAPACPKVTQLLIEKGEGAYLITTDGERYLDFASGIAVNALGHCHPRVVKAAKEQTEKLIHGGFNVVNYPTALKLAEELAKVTPGELNMFFFSNGGAEAVEGGLKLARYVTRKPAIIAFRGAFHGRTRGALSVSSSNSDYREHYAPFLPSVFYAPY
ncbi:aminotransferase class III-fold pyridoxal phosphate-dependent enzyme, partial [Candidatus Aerophobetes bacterium]